MKGSAPVEKRATLVQKIRNISDASNLFGIITFFIAGGVAVGARKNLLNKWAQAGWAFAAGTSAAANMSEEGYREQLGTPRGLAHAALDVASVGLGATSLVTLPMKTLPRLLPVTARESSLLSLITAGTNSALRDAEKIPIGASDGAIIGSRISNVLGVSASVLAGRYPQISYLPLAAYSGWALPGLGNAARLYYQKEEGLMFEKGVAAIGVVMAISSLACVAARQQFPALQTSLIALATPPATRLGKALSSREPDHWQQRVAQSRESIGTEPSRNTV